MKVKAFRDVYLSNPTQALRLDLEDGQKFLQQAELVSPDLDMTDCGWVKIGSAEILITIEVTPQKMAVDCAAALRGKLKELDAEHEKKRRIMEEAIGKFLSLGWSGSGSTS